MIIRQTANSVLLCMRSHVAQLLVSSCPRTSLQATKTTKLMKIMSTTLLPFHVLTRTPISTFFTGRSYGNVRSRQSYSTSPGTNGVPTDSTMSYSTTGVAGGVTGATVDGDESSSPSSSSSSSSPPLSSLDTLPMVNHLNPQALLAHYAQVMTPAVKLGDLMKYGKPPLDEPTLLSCAESTRKQLLAGLARRVTAHLSLPFLPATNPSLQTIYSLYSSAFAKMASLPVIKTLEENNKLCEAIGQMVEEHRDNIPTLAKGFQESRKYLPDPVITNFLDRAIRNRITLRLLAEQHLSLSAASLPHLRARNSAKVGSPSSLSSSPSPSTPILNDPRVEPSARGAQSTSLSPNRVGILDLALSPHSMVRACAGYVSELCEATYGVSPNFTIEGAGLDAKIGGIGSHLEYILTELLKNAFRATVEFHTPKLIKMKDNVDDDGGGEHDEIETEEENKDVFRFDDSPSAFLSAGDFPEVVVTIGVVPGALTIRIRDRGGGVPPENLPNVFSYSFTSVPVLPDPDFDPDSPQDSDMYGGSSGAGYYGGVGGGGSGGGPDTTLKTSMGTLAGLGFGLPLSRIYSGYFGGSLDLVSMYGWGTDVYCVIKTVQT